MLCNASGELTSEIVNVNKEQEWTQDGSLRNSEVYSHNRDELRSAVEVGRKPVVTDSTNAVHVKVMK